MHKVVLALASGVIFSELSLVIYYHRAIFDWISHNLWVIIVPFTKVIFKKLVALKLIAFLKVIAVLLLNLFKLLLLKIFKTLSMRYGVFFSQSRWRWIRWCKVMFLRQGKQFFRSTSRFWNGFSKGQQWFIAIAFFPVLLILFLLGLSFNITRKTVVQKTQETAIFQTAISASTGSRGVSKWISRLDRAVLKRIKDLTPRQ